MYEFTYSKYLEEVVKILETDPVFNEKLRQMPEADIKVRILLFERRNVPTKINKKSTILCSNT